MINTKRVTLTFSKRCNMRCPFCYGYFNGKDLLDIKKYKEIISKCQMFHIETLNIAGGDPLMYRRIGEIVKYSKSLGLRTTMDTNCLLFDPREHEDIIKSLDMISVPIDGCNAETHDRIRVYKGSFDKIIYSLNEITDISKAIEIRVNTVIVKDNCKQLLDMAELLNQYPVTYWHIYDFIPVGNGRFNKNDFYIDYAEYESVILDIMSKKFRYSIEHNLPDRRKQEHLYISSDGIVYSNSNNINEDYILGENVLDYSGSNILECLDKKWKNGN